MRNVVVISKDYYADLSLYHLRECLDNYKNPFRMRRNNHQLYLCRLPLHHVSNRSKLPPVSSSSRVPPDSESQGCQTHSSIPKPSSSTSFHMSHRGGTEDKDIVNIQLLQNNFLVSCFTGKKEISCGMSM